jgi:excisionase family DNA binding protein
MTTQSTHPPPGTWNAQNLLTVFEVAEWARVHPKTVYRWIKEGKLEALQEGCLLFRPAEAGFCAIRSCEFIRRVCQVRCTRMHLVQRFADRAQHAARVEAVHMPENSCNGRNFPL